MYANTHISPYLHCLFSVYSQRQAGGEYDNAGWLPQSPAIASLILSRVQLGSKAEFELPSWKHAIKPQHQEKDLFQCHLQGGFGEYSWNSLIRHSSVSHSFQEMHTHPSVMYVYTYASPLWWGSHHRKRITVSQLTDRCRWTLTVIRARRNRNHLISWKPVDLYTFSPGFCFLPLWRPTGSRSLLCR